MTQSSTNHVEQQLYSNPDSRFFGGKPTRGPAGENLDIPAFMRRGVDISKQETRKINVPRKQG